MRNVKLYDSFLRNINFSFKIKFLKISLVRTYIFNLNNNDIYYRKASLVRKIALFGKERAYLLEKGLSFNYDLSNLGITKIDRLVSEYVVPSYCLDRDVSNIFDVVEKDKKKIVTSDSIIRKVRRDEIVTMCFDEDKLANVLFINKNNKHDYYINI